MTELLDANVVIRYLTDDPPELAERAAALIDSETEFTLTPHILAEVAYVLTRVYGRDRGQVVQALIDLLQRDNLRLLGVEPEFAVEALELCRPSHRVSFADALLWAEARSRTPARIWSFDRRFPANGVDLREPEAG